MVIRAISMVVSNHRSVRGVKERSWLLGTTVVVQQCPYGSSPIGRVLVLVERKPHTATPRHRQTRS